MNPRWIGKREQGDSVIPCFVVISCIFISLLGTTGCNRADPQTAKQKAKAKVHAAEVQPQVQPSVRTAPQTQETAQPELVPDPIQAQVKPGQSGAGAKLPAQTNQANGHGRKAEVDALFTEPTILQVDIEIPRAGMSLLRHTGWGNGQNRPIARATVKEGGHVYTNVAVHLKGAAGSFRSLDDKPALTLCFDKFVPGQSFHGLHKISLNNSVQDSSYLCEKICRELFIAAGVPTPRAAHAMVALNGRDLGLYVLLEGANKQFLKRYFSNATGNLYDGGFCREIGTSLVVNSGDNPRNNTGLRALCSVLRQGNPTMAQLQRVLDVDRFISMVAMEMITCHWDGYTLNRNNWRIFHDLDSNRMVFIPHGLDQMFGAGRQFDPGSLTRPQHISGEVTRAVLGTAEGASRYRARVAELYTNVFKADQIASRIDEITATILPVVAESDPQLARSVQQHANGLRSRVIRRWDLLGTQLGAPGKTLEFGSDGVVRLTGWKPSLVRSGDPVLTQGKDTAGNSILAINAGNATSSSSWRMRVFLGPGQYQFQGRLRVNGVTIEQGDTRGGAGLRISKGTMPRKVTGTTNWTDYRYAFVVEDTADVELICELRATKGEAWFDAGSLKLVRLQ